MVSKNPKKGFQPKNRIKFKLSAKKVKSYHTISFPIVRLDSSHESPTQTPHTHTPSARITKPEPTTQVLPHTHCTKKTMITTEVTTTTAPYNYAGEAFLSTSIPDYPLERILLILRIILAFVTWLVLFPMLTMKRTTNPSKSTTTSSTTNRGIEEKSSPSSSSSKRRGGKKGGKQKFKNDKLIKPQNEDTNTNEEEVVVISDVMNFICITGFLVTLCYLVIMVSPDNTFPIRTVFEAPLFTREECHEWIRRSEQAARRNYDMAKQQQEQTNNISDSSLSFLEEPIGWQKKRHQQYSTTDLNVVTDPFSKEDRQWLKERLDARLAPTIQRVYGVPIGSIRANDVSKKRIVCVKLSQSF